MVDASNDESALLSSDMHPEQNPYTPPPTESDRVRPDIRSGSFFLASVSAVAALCYLVFTIMLLRSTPVDRVSGWLFTINVPVLGALVFFSAKSLKIAVRYAFAAAGIQAAIACTMLLIPIGDVIAVLVINGVIIAICLILGGSAWHGNRRMRFVSESARSRHL